MLLANYGLHYKIAGKTWMNCSLLSTIDEGFKSKIYRNIVHSGARYSSTCWPTTKGKERHLVMGDGLDLGIKTRTTFETRI